MSNSFYAATDSIVPFTRANGSVVQGEFTKIEQAFDEVESRFSLNRQSATSISTVTIGLGSKAFLASTNRDFSVGQYVIVSASAAVSNYMLGQIAAYNPETGSLTVSVETISGSGTFSSWSIALSPFNSDDVVVPGQLLVGVTSSSYKADISGTMRVTGALTAGSYSTAGSIAGGSASIAGNVTSGGVGLFSGGAVVGSDSAGWGRFVTAGSAVYIQSGNQNTSGGLPNSIVFGNMYGGAGAAVHAAGDNVQNLGLGSFRWAVVFAGTGTINTSDEREKQWRGGLNEAELRAAKRIAGELGFYRWLDAIAEKGDAARLHFGAKAQQAWSIMADEGLVDPIVDGLPGNAPYAFLCFDEWDATAEQLDGDANVVMPARDAGNRFGLRLDQLALFLIAAQEQRLSALEAR